MAGRPQAAWSYNYKDLAKLTELEENTVMVAASRGRRGQKNGFVPEDFESVVLWIFRNSPDELRVKIMGEMGFFKDKENAKRVLAKEKQKKAKKS